MNEIVIDLDLVEELAAKSQSRQKNKSMDLAFGITDGSKLNEMVMVELRLNYQNNLRNLDKSKLDGKVNGSLAILSNNPPIFKQFIFIFQTSLKEQAKNRLFRMYPRINSNYIVMDAFDLKSAFF